MNLKFMFVVLMFFSFVIPTFAGATNDDNSVTIPAAPPVQGELAAVSVSVSGKAAHVASQSAAGFYSCSRNPVNYIVETAPAPFSAGNIAAGQTLANRRGFHQLE